MIFLLFSLVGYLGGLSAASALIIVITLALSNMCLNHIILPIYQPTARNDIYRWLLWHRRVLITTLIWAGYLFHYLYGYRISIEMIGVVAFSASVQFLPGIVSILYWPQGNKKRDSWQVYVYLLFSGSFSSYYLFFMT